METGRRGEARFSQEKIRKKIRKLKAYLAA
jgi:hypothetical protein